MAIYRHIETNRRATWLWMFFFVLLVAAMVEVIALALGMGPGPAVATLVVASIFVLISYRFSDRVVLGMSGAREVAHDKDPDLYHLVENLCIGAGVPVPRIYIIDDTAPNAFATGRDPKHAYVVVTKGLLQKLDKLELEGVLAHELSHIRNYDIRLMTLVVMLVGLVALLADFFLRWTWYGAGHRRGNRGKGEGAGGAILLVVALLMAILAPIAAQLIRLAISRRRESLADASSALL
ncbi:MAG TPA: M48 family metallopeptidase, partial [Dehalococcoidia bacterium]|nr:M48 family metallopeptidase [Dehalococcoidia bacterium]